MGSRKKDRPEPPRQQDRAQRFLYPTDDHLITKGWSNSLKGSELWKDDHELLALLHDVEKAIENGVPPQRISQGSSGSYFVRNTEGRIVGVFKPSDEEPYSELNPKIIKWMHRTICPCLFGRGCLMPNVGFLSEAAASIVDRHFDLGIVPRTEIVDLAADSFNYGYWWPCKKRPARPPPKTGSFQLFVQDLHSSQEALQLLDMAQSRYPQVSLSLQLEFEKLVVLDYIIRNTDRTFDNWLFVIEWRDPVDGTLLSTEALPPADLDPKAECHLKIVGIDHGLAFPWKHPNEWRSYPYSWLELRQAKVPFSQQLKDHMLPLLRDANCWDDLINSKLRSIFKLDDLFSEHYFRLQMDVVRGQMRNLLIALELGYSPHRMVKDLPPIRVEADDAMFERRYGKKIDRGGFEVDVFFSNSDRKMWKKKAQSKPCFSIF